MVRRCTGEFACPFQKLAHLRHFVSRRVLDIEGLGEKQLTLFTERGWLDQPADIFRLHEKRAEILEMDRFGDQRRQPDRHRRAPPIALDRFIYGLGIRHIGETTSIALARHFETAEAFVATARAAAGQTAGAAFAELSDLDGLGPTAVEAVLAFARARQPMLIPAEISLEEHLRRSRIPKLNSKARAALEQRYVDWAAFEAAALEAAAGTPGDAFQEVASVDAVGVVAARMIAEFFGEDHNRALVDNLLAQLQVIPRRTTEDHYGRGRKDRGHRHPGADDARRGQGPGRDPGRQGLGFRLEEACWSPARRGVKARRGAETRRRGAHRGRVAGPDRRPVPHR